MKFINNEENEAMEIESTCKEIPSELLTNLLENLITLLKILCEEDDGD